MNKQYKKISILGCGWAGLPLGKYLSSKGYTVKGSTTRTSKLAELALNGIIPFHVNAVPVPDGANLDGFFECDLLVVTIPPAKREGINDWAFMLHSSIARKAVEYGIKKVILFSSTSVYPSNKSLVTEADAEAIPSPRSGVIMLDLERCYRSSWFSTVVLRMGGLFGPGRDPGKFLLSGTKQYNPDAPVNLVHLDDVIGSINHILQEDLGDATFNVVSPNHPTRKEFYNAAAELRNLELDWAENLQQLKKVSSLKLIESGYEFIYPNPTSALKGKTPSLLRR